MAKRTRPRRGSLAYSPRKRAKSLVPEIKKRNINELKPLGFLGYKVGMLHLMAINRTPNSPTNNMEVAIPATVIATPPLKVFGIRLYHKEYLTEIPLTDIYAENIDKDLKRRTNVPKKIKHKIEEIEKFKDKITRVCLLCHTTPRILKIKKVPDIIEVPISGNVESALNFAKEKLGKELNIRDVFTEFSYVSITGVTKGKGWQGPVKRWGAVVRGRKTTAMRRHVVLNPETPAVVSWRALQGGQMGFHTRTELNKLILMISNKNITPKGGFKNFGILNTDYVIVKGSVQGTAKRPIVLSIVPLERERKKKEKY
ncbi:MAG: 50S ribosomal protein L3, partial [Candidatus Altarchaeaceae archaeon]